MTDAIRADSGVPVPGKAAAGAPEDKALRPDERAELESLRDEVTTLRGQNPAKRRRGRWRAPVAATLIVLGCILAPISVLGIWTANQVSNTDRYVATVSPLIQDPAIQHAATDKITTAIMAQIDVPALASQTATQLNQRGLPRAATLLQNFSGQITGAIQGFVHNAVARIITSPAMNNIWLQANRTAHAQLVAALSGSNNGALTTSNGQVVLNLQPFIKVAQQDLANRGLTFLEKLPTPNASFPLFPSRDLVKAQTAYRLINDLKIVLPILCLLLIAAGVYVARSHRRALIGAGLGFAASMFLLAAILLIVRNAYLNAIPAGTLPSDAAAAAFDILVRFIRLALRALLVVGLVVAAGAFLAGPSASAVRIRSWFAAGFSWLRRSGEHFGVSTGPVGNWTYAHRRGLRIGVVALACLIFVFLGQPTAATVIVIVVLLLVALGLIELIGRPPARSAPGAPPGPPPPGPPAPRSPEPQAH
jgi:anti-sigma factor RsiW